jgi:hypothetical protein
MNRQQFLKVLAASGATLDTDCEDFDLNVDAPKGKVFSDTGTHCICIPYNNNCGQSWKSEAYKEAARHVSNGFRDCETQDCDTCGTGSYA